MRTAITSTGNTLDSKVDIRFGRCSFFVIYDDKTGSIEYIPNPLKDEDEGVGPAAVQLVNSRNADQIVSGEFGMKIKPLLDSQRIRMIVLKQESKKISEIIELLNHKKFK